MNVDLELYRVFCEVVKYKNISKTADSIGISQSAVTQSIKKLEDLLGGQLFFRNKRGVELTEEGKKLYEYIDDSIETMNNAENMFSQYIDVERGMIRIGGGSTIISSLIGDLLIEFIKKYPGIELSITSGLSEDLLKKLSNGEIDLVALNLPYLGKEYSNIEIEELRKSKFCFFATKKYLEDKKDIDLFNDPNLKFVLPKFPSIKRKILDEYCQKNNINITPHYECSNSTILKNMVLNDIGIGFNNITNLKDIKDKIVIIKELDGYETGEGIATLKKEIMNKATLELVKMIKNKYNG